MDAALKLNQKYVPAGKQKNLQYVEILHVSPEYNLAWGKKILKDGSHEEKLTIYNMKGVYLCGKPEENLTSLYSEETIKASK